MSTLTYRGFPCCLCLAEWLPFFEAELKARGVIKKSLDIAQLNGNATASAGTHKGGAFDVWQHDPETMWVARQMGAPATWNRVTGSFVDNEHTHGVLKGCAHNAAAFYQITAVFAGFNGLGDNGMGGPDDGPRPIPGRTWRQGIEWHRQQVARRKRAARIQKLRARRAKLTAIIQKLTGKKPSHVA